MFAEDEKQDLVEYRKTYFNSNLGGGVILPPSDGFPLITQKR